jgi:predicted transcriptional regulator
MVAKALHNLFLPAPRLNQLNLMQQIALDPHVTQSELAHSCSLSVAMVNNYMKDLCAQGYLHYERKSSRSIFYHLTTAGETVLEETGRELNRELAAFFCEAKARVLDSILRQAGKPIHRVVLFGTGDLAELAYHALESAEVSIVGVCDGSTPGRPREWCGREMLNPTQIRFLVPDAVVVADTSLAEGTYQSLSGLRDRGILVILLDGLGLVRVATAGDPQPQPATPPGIGRAL